MSWKLPLNQIGSGSTFIIGTTSAPSRYKETLLTLNQHPWLEEILQELKCDAAGEPGTFALKLDVEKQSETYRVKAHLRMFPELECVRSLTPFRTDIETDSEAIFVRALERKSSGEHEISESELESYEHDGAGLLLSEFVTDLIYTSLPDFPLCQPECRGLCSDCGCDLNTAKECGRTLSSSKSEECPHACFFQ